jgi:hypothetical protein
VRVRLQVAKGARRRDGRIQGPPRECAAAPVRREGAREVVDACSNGDGDARSRCNGLRRVSRRANSRGGACGWEGLRGVGDGRGTGAARRELGLTEKHELEIKGPSFH